MVLGAPRTYQKKFKFYVRLVDPDVGPVDAGFQSVSELSVEAAKVEHFEGGVVIPDKTPGRLTYSDVTLERGATGDAVLYNWMRQVGDAAFMGSEVVEPGYKRNLDIVQLDRSNKIMRLWRLYNAWPQKFVGGEWDNDSDENVIESVTLSYDFFELIQ